MLYDRQQIIAYAEQCYPNEACGLIADGQLIPITNISSDPANGFQMCPVELADALDCHTPTAIFHSHPDCTATPSQHDLARMNRADEPLPWVIVSYPDIDVTLTYPSGFPPLIGREFTHGVQDCYALIRDFYQLKLGIELTDYHRDDEWWAKGQNLYLDNYEDEGFYEVSELQYGDFLLMQVMSDTTNHAAIYVGDGKILHHLYGRLSRVDVYGGYTLERTTRKLRHKMYNATNVKLLDGADYGNSNQT